MRRVLALWCPDWSVVAADVVVARPVVVRAADTVVACSEAARAFGIRTGMRRREAQARCPNVTIIEHNPDRDARAFARVLDAVDALVPDVATDGVGWLLLDIRGPSRRMGGEWAVILRLRQAVDAAIAEVADCPVVDVGGVGGPPASRIGVADGWYAAVCAARFASAERIVAPGEQAAFLAPLPVHALSDSLGDGQDLIELLNRLGVATLGALAALPRRTVADRFGTHGRLAHQLARGEVDEPLRLRIPDEPLECVLELDPPLDRVDAVAFAAREVAERFLALLSRRLLLASVVAIETETAHVEQQVRHWRSLNGFTAAALVDRLRWQLDGWLHTSSAADRPTAPITNVRFHAVEVLHGGQQLTVADSMHRQDRQVAQTLTRLQGMLGSTAVLVGVLSDGRDPASWVTAVPWNAATPSSVRTDSTTPWPGRLPRPAPTILPRPPLAARLVDPDAVPVQVSGRGELSAAPARLQIGDRPWCSVDRWAGPWPADERWWESSGRRRARMQVVIDSGAGLLLTVESGRWHVEAFYD
ncbi:MAG: DNA polymerase Y family protein [Nitriliruptoraceae bacterium]